MPVAEAAPHLRRSGFGGFGVVVVGVGVGVAGACGVCALGRRAVGSSVSAHGGARLLRLYVEIGRAHV